MITKVGYYHIHNNGGGINGALPKCRSLPMEAWWMITKVSYNYRVYNITVKVQHITNVGYRRIHITAKMQLITNTSLVVDYQGRPQLFSGHLKIAGTINYSVT